jgi:hypothetical protein
MKRLHLDLLIITVATRHSIACRTSNDSRQETTLNRMIDAFRRYVVRFDAEVISSKEYLPLNRTGLDITDGVTRETNVIYSRIEPFV